MPDQFKLEGGEHTRCSPIVMKAKPHEKRSIAWDFRKGSIRKSDKKKGFYCGCCEIEHKRQQLKVADGTNSVLGHLEDSRGIGSYGNKEETNSSQLTIAQSKQHLAIVTTRVYE